MEDVRCHYCCRCSVVPHSFWDVKVDQVTQRSCACSLTSPPLVVNSVTGMFIGKTGDRNLPYNIIYITYIYLGKY